MRAQLMRFALLAQLALLAFLTLLSVGVGAYHYDPQYMAYNLNTNQTAQHPTNYWGERTNHEYTPSPDNWRFPFYSLMLDRFVNGDPFNDNINGTHFEHDIHSNQIRHGGDLEGLIDTLDYLQGMGVKGLYLAGSIMMNAPWTYDSFSPLDLTLLDPHFGNLALWQHAIDEIHARGMYVLLDNTFATLGDLIGFEGYLNETAPFSFQEHKGVYKSSRQYLDFSFTDQYNDTCSYPQFWNETGYPVDADAIKGLKGCYDSEFDLYGDTEAFGVYPDWRRQITKFASVQDRLREWHPPVRAKLENFYCMMIAQLDIDGFRFDKALQSTIDAFGDLNKSLRSCASRHGKTNFFLAGEITGGNNLASIWLGRGRQPNMLPPDLIAAVNANHTTQEFSLRSPDRTALDAAAFHYSVYRTLTRFLGMDGNLEAGYDTPLNLVDMWNTMLITNDFTNANTGEFDPRHMFGTMNQDVFRWPSIRDGIHRQLLGNFVTSILLPGIPLLLWGEEQSLYVLDNTASNYIFGRQPLSASSAWQMHGCYSLDSTQYYQFPVESARNGCHDDTVSYDHRDPSAPVRNILKHMFHLRDQYPVLRDGGWLQQLSNQTWPVVYPGSTGVVTETGLWSVMRSGVPGVQDFSTQEQGNVPVWLLYSNVNASKTFHFNCSDEVPAPRTNALLSPFTNQTVVRNLFFPYERIPLETSAQFLGINGSTNATGCISQLAMDAYGFKAFVPQEDWVGPRPALTNILVNGLKGHDARILSTTTLGGSEDVSIELIFSQEVDCEEITAGITLHSSTSSGRKPRLDTSSVVCNPYLTRDDVGLQGMILPSYSWSARLHNVENGVHRVTVRNVAPGVKDRFIFRIGQADNPIVFPRTANYSSALLQRSSNGNLLLSHAAAGADLFRYTTNWGASYSEWQPLVGSTTAITELPWTGTSKQTWDGVHVRVEYFSRMTGSSDHIQESDVDNSSARRFPHLYWNGPYNLYGYDMGLPNQFKHTGNNQWTFDFATEWPALAQVNVWGMNSDGKPDQTYVMGDVDGDSILDRLPPSSLSKNVVNVTAPPPMHALAWHVTVNDATRQFVMTPKGSSVWQLLLFLLLAVIPVVTATGAVLLYIRGFYKVSFNQYGIKPDKAQFRQLFELFAKRETSDMEKGSHVCKNGYFTSAAQLLGIAAPTQEFLTKEVSTLSAPITKGKEPEKRRRVLIATMEYDIEDWKIKVKIGGLGVMAQLMGKALLHQDLIWVIPCVGGIDYPCDTPAEPMKVSLLGNEYTVHVQYHQVNNIKYVLLDAPVFRKQTQAEPYPARMDDLPSAIYYSAWNQCIAETIKRFPIDLYHINDYHGCLAPLYLLPRTIPVCLSLHNAEFQGLWPMRTPGECAEIYSVFNLTPDVVQRFVQFGEVFNLLHAGASYLRVYQESFGAVGVSKKYGKRAHLRYPIFWGLRNIGQLPNPDPTDTGEWNGQLSCDKDVPIDAVMEAARPQLRVEAQRWAGLEEDPTAELFVFVGRWAMQKGVDLIADVFPSILKKHPKAQLICVGPIIDLYGKFAALKLEKLMAMYPKRVFSKPEFTALPPCIFSGAEFALIPSRDEPFGLVAVEFGRKGALGIGARVGGLGNMPGWYYSVESMSSSHLLSQFRQAIEEALSSRSKQRAAMRARSAKQRFPVAQWIATLEALQSTAIKSHNKISPMVGRNMITPAASEESDLKNVAESLRPTIQRSHTTALPASNSAPELGKESSTSVLLSRSLAPKFVKSNSVPDLSELSPQRPTKNPNRQPVRRNLVARKVVDYSSMAEEGLLDAEPSYNGAQGLDAPSDAEQDVYITPRSSMDQERAERPPALNVLAEERTLQSRPNLAVEDQGRPSSRLSFADDTRFHSRSSLCFDDARKSSSSRLSFGDVKLQTRSSLYIENNQTPTFGETDSTDSLPSLQSSGSMLSTDNVVRGTDNLSLQQVDDFFADSQGTYYNEFARKLHGKDAMSDGNNCIEDFLLKSEKKWFQLYLQAKLGNKEGHTARKRASLALSRSSMSLSRASSTIFSQYSRPVTPTTEKSSMPTLVLEDSENSSVDSFAVKQSNTAETFAIGKNHQTPRFLRKWLQTRLGDWPVYSFILALGQIMAANSYQLTLLTGRQGQSASQLYMLCGIFMACSILFWLAFRRLQSALVLTVPFVLYGAAFLIIGLARFGTSIEARGTIQDVAIGLYAAASSSGSLFFSLNFGDEGGSPVRSWVFRACIIQGLQQVYVTVLWFWGSYLGKQMASGVQTTLINDTKVTIICLPIAGALWVIAAIVFCGLPDYYRRTPGRFPSFYRTLFRRKIILWFFVTVIIQNFFLSSQYGRSWTFLWSSQHAPKWQVACLVVFFFIIAWIVLLWILARLSVSHSWLLPVFAIGLGAPRWAQTWWAVSGMGFWLPWTGSALASALVSRALWLWLGTLDTIQSVGIGMILLSTMTRIHVAFTLIAAQVIGAAITAIARAWAPNNVGPGPVFPNVVVDFSGISNAWFWVAMLLNCAACACFAFFFRKEQLNKP